jgi:protein O-GlcNAc transferase
MTHSPTQLTLDLALQHHQAGRLHEAESLYRQILTQDPAHNAAMHLLAEIARQTGRDDLALDLTRRALALNPNLPSAHNNLGNLLRDKGQLDEAIAAYRHAIALRPTYAEAHSNLASALKNKGQLDEAIAACRQAIALKPDYAPAHSNLGNILRMTGRLDAAIAACQQAIALNPNLPEAHNNLGNALRDNGQLDEAISAYRQTIALNPNLPETHSNLGSVLKDMGQLDEAIAAYRHAIALRPTYSEAHSNLVFAMQYHPRYDAEAIAEETRRWNRQYAEPLRSFIEVHHNDRQPDRLLRVGYVSADFRTHASAHFLIPLLKHHDRQQVEVYCYAQVVRPDAKTLQFQHHAAAWRNIVGISDEQVAAQIRQDRIDILVDLKLHTAENRLLVFARKPAPVQVTWLGNPGSTGLTTIDYRLSDPYLDPPAVSAVEPPGMDESVYSERTIRLPETFWCYDPLDGRDIPVSPLPAQTSGIVTFGCLNNFCKINDDVLALWANVLRQVPNSRLLLLARPGSHRQRTLDRLQKDGIDPTRVEFISNQPHEKYLQTYHRIDIGLDTFPCNGHTTSLDSFWMGVPVVTLVGPRSFGRAGWCQLSNLGLTELAAQTPDQFARIAVQLANDFPRLQQLRSTLRPRMEQSPLMDAPKFARNMEAAYRQMWHTWCAAAPPR